MGKPLAVSVSIAVALTLTVGSASLAEYTRDDSFAGDGLVTVGSTGFDWYQDVEPVDGGYVTAGAWNDSRVVVAKHLADGSLDTGFADEGRRVIEMGAYSWGVEVMQRPRGDFVVLASTIRGFALIGIGQDGSINRNFGDRGFVKQRIGAANLELVATLDSQQRIVVATSEMTSPEFKTSRLHVWRFTKGGGVDRSLSRGDLTASPQRVNDPSGVVTDDQDRIWLVTSQSAKGSRKTAGGSLLRISERGARVQTVRRFSVWDADGTAPVGIDRRDDDSFLIGLTGNTTGRVGAIALNQRGRNVQSYGNGGVVRTECSDLCFVSEQEMDADGALVLVGGVDVATSDRVRPEHTWVARFTADGRRDVDFMGGWERVFRLDRRFDMAYGVSVDDQGQVLVAGESGMEAYLMRLSEVN